MVNSMLISLSASENLWEEALLAICYILNRISFWDGSKTPFELWNDRTPRLNYLKLSGCLAKVGIPEPKKIKIGPETIDAIFVGYSLIVALIDL